MALEMQRCRVPDGHQSHASVAHIYRMLAQTTESDQGFEVSRRALRNVGEPSDSATK